MTVASKPHSAKFLSNSPAKGKKGVLRASNAWRIDPGSGQGGTGLRWRCSERIAYFNAAAEAHRDERGQSMVHLVLTLCMMAWQSHCMDERPVFQDMSLTSCMVQGQQIAAEWLADHPKWMLANWRCEQNGPRDIPS